MIARIKRSALGLAAVLTAYAAYALTIARFIEPPAPARMNTASTPAERQAANNLGSRYSRMFSAYFPPGHWSQNNPKVLENEQAILLIKDYKPLGDGEVELNPCVMIFFPKHREDPYEPQREALILDAPRGAVLKFEGGFDLSQARIGRLTRGRLDGEITIYSDMEEEGPDDDMRIVTRDVQLNENRIWSEHDVNFRVGENVGYGSQLEMRLLPSESQRGGTGLSIGGLESMSLARNVRMKLLMNQSGLLPGDAPGGQPAKKDEPAPPTPVEVSCQGPFHFDMVHHVATFSDRVDVLRLNPAGASDQMTCELLSIFFSPKSQPVSAEAAKIAKKNKKSPQKPAAPAAKPGAEPLRPTALKAQGHPVVVRSPSTAAHARCERLDYDLVTRKVTLEGGREVELIHGANQIHAPALQFQPSDQPGGLGTAWASGPGWLRATPDKNPKQVFEVRWNEQLHMRRHEGNQVISLQGRPKVNMVGMGQLIANEVHLWVIEPENPPPAPVDPAQKKPGVRPDRLLALGDVQIDSPQLTGVTRRLEAWFQQAPAVTTAAANSGRAANSWPVQQVAATQPVHRAPRTSGAAAAPAPAANQLAASPENHAILRQGNPLVQAAAPRSMTPAAVAPAATQTTPSTDQGEAAVPPKQRYDVRGQLIRLQVAMQGEQAEVSDVSVDDDVILRETQTARPEDKPLVIRGKRLQMKNANRDDSHATVVGQPAQIEARGMTMEGATVELNRGTNRLWIDGAGTMTLPVRRGLQGEVTQNEQSLRVTWQGRMNFDGTLARFERSVVARGETQTLKTETLDVELKNRIDFSRAGKQDKSDKTEVHKITCRGGAYFENVTIQEGERTSIDRMQTRDLAINQTTGELAAQGPGWLTSVRTGGASALDAQPPRATTRPVSTGTATIPPAKDSSGPKLSYLRVDFQRAIEGNTIRREVTFVGDVRAVQGPVAYWDSIVDPDEPNGLGESGVLLNSDRLTVLEMAPAQQGRGPIELIAQDNALVEGRQFTARAHRITYTQAKELIILEGTGRSDAELYRQTSIGGAQSRAAARRILFWRSSNRVEVDDARYIDLNQFGQGKKKDK